MFGEFNEVTQLKTSLAKYSIEFNDLAVQMRPHQIAYLRLLGGPYTLLYVRRSVDRLHRHVILPRFYKFIVQYFFLYQHVSAQRKPDHVGQLMLVEMLANMLSGLRPPLDVISFLQREIKN